MIEAQWTPVGLRDAKTTVVLQMAGNPVTVVEADAERELSDGREGRDQGRSEGHAGRARAARSRRSAAQVLADYQVAYNGVKVRIDRYEDSTALKAAKGVTAVAAARRWSCPTTSRASR